jgi:lipopolysaccharide transport system ATP-binding protein
LNEGVSGVLVTHDWSAILRLCEYALELNNGRIIAEGDSEQIICDYLKLSDQLDPNRIAHFSDQCPTSLFAASGENWVCDIPIEVNADGPVFFNYSVEKLLAGQDWQILFLGSETLVASSQGSYLARIMVKHLPLPGGEYRLNLFLSGAKPADGGSTPGFDIRSWTTGNSLKLSVDGVRGLGLVKLPLVVEHL